MSLFLDVPVSYTDFFTVFVGISEIFTNVTR